MTSLQTAARFAFVGALALAAATLPARAEETPRIATIDMVGTGVVTAAPDMAMITSGVVSDADTAAEALAANTEAMSAVIARIKEAGIEQRDIQTSGFSVQPRYRQVKSSTPEEYRSEVFGYRVSNNVSVRVRDLAKLGGLIDVMVRDGANQVGGVAFIVSEEDKLKDGARKEAMADAIRKAEIYAEAAGVKLGRVLSINEQDFGGPRPMMMMARAEAKMDAAPAPMEAGESSLEVRVNVTWELVQP
ncbi:SIMPL domain-containing protein [Stappia sp. WLB 29]|uniref:SIMPL domain-containing protein n=1 Tax=Stappia sp. WLB 29 TaxID=2925220 RepID=UPI0024BE4B57|nr:SIMPL domain-containing protein [Stappia sp. WLB 29]